MRLQRSYLGLIAAGFLVSCTEPTDPATVEAPDLTVLAEHTEGLYRAHGGGIYILTLSDGTELKGQFDMRLRQMGPDGSSKGWFAHRLEFFGELIDFSAVATCMTVDPAEGRAWIGGVVKENRSVAEPFASGDIYQPGREIWFRVLDDGPNRRRMDRTTFVGFEGGAGIITSKEYCDTRPWPEDNARTNPIVRGGVRIARR